MPVPVGWDVNRAAELYRTGASLKTLAADLGIARSALRRQLIKFGVEMRPNSRPAKADIDTDYLIYLREVKKLTWREIGERVGMSTPGAQSRYLAGVRDRQQEPSPHRWAELLRAALLDRSVVKVSAVVESHLGRPPTRSEINAARRAAGRLSDAGGVRKVKPKSHVLLARLDATDEEIFAEAGQRSGDLWARADEAGRD